MEKLKTKWKDLDTFVSLLDGHPLLKEIKEKPLTTVSIDNLVYNGWHVALFERTRGTTYSPLKRIILNKNSIAFNRDKKLFHELVRAYYSLGDIDPSELEKNTDAIVDWAARKLRANPKLLRYAVNAFRLEPHIYDKASLEAFYELGKTKQRLFPFLEDYKEMGTFMD